MKATLLALLTCLALAPGVASAADTQTSCSDHAEAILAALQAGDFEQARADFNDTMQAGLSAHKLSQMWMTTLPAKVGTFDHAAEPTSSTLGSGETVVSIPMKFDQAWLNLQVACNAGNKVNGLYIKPGVPPTTK